MRTCLFEIHKAKKELKQAIQIKKAVLRQKISDMKLSYVQIKKDLKLIFNEMNAQYIANA